MHPRVAAQLVVLLKDTSLAYVVGYNELARTIKNLQNALGNRYLFTLFIIGLLIYLIMNLTLSWLARVIAKRSGPKLGKVTPDDLPPVGAQGTQAITMVRPNRGKPPS